VREAFAEEFTTTANVETTRRRLSLMFQVGAALSAAFLLLALILRAHMNEPGRALVEGAEWWHVIGTAHLALLALGSSTLPITTRAAAVGLDAVGLMSTSAIFAASAFGIADEPARSFNVILCTGMLLNLRAAIVPSSWQFSFALSVAAATVSIAMLVPTFAGHAASVHPGWSVRHQVLATVLWLSAFIASATITSRVVYGLHREIHNARSVGQYLLHEKLGEGGMGIVYRATHALLKRDTAVKLLPPRKVDAETVSRFEREVTLTARLTHPNTISIFDYGRAQSGEFFYAMEYLDGLTLDEIVALTGPLPPGRVVKILAQVCSSLEEAHGLGLIHRDIKPSNIMVTCRSGTPDLVKVLDFGLVKNFLPRVETTGVNTVVGTPNSMSPESITAPDEVGPKSDLYSVGVVAYFLLTGTHVFNGRNAIELCAAHLRDPPESLSSRLGKPLPAALEGMVLAALTKDPAARPDSARDMRRAFLACPGVDEWTEDDAVSWWRDVGAPALSAREGRRNRLSLESARTIAPKQR
jgi:eukaryotic-like serine/threonine-protein kinase